MKNRRFGKIKLSTLSMAIFVIAMGVRSFTAPYESAGLISQIKYFICVLGIFVSWEIIAKRKNQERLFKAERNKILLMIACLAAISLFLILYNHAFTSRTVLELIFLTVPIVYAYTYINSLSFEQIYFSMVIALALFMGGYFLNLGMSISGIISSLSSISFRNSFSLLESSVYAAPSITLACFFLYYRKNKFITACSVIFVLLTFKRLSVIFVLLMLFLPYFVNLCQPVKKSTLRIVKIGIFVATLLYFYIMIPGNAASLENLLHIQMNQFTMGRAWRFIALYTSGFKSSGLGSTYTYLVERYGVSLEMDLLRLAFEVSFFGVAILINQLVDIVSKSRYCLLVMIYMFSNLLFSHSLADMFGWLLLYIIFACVQYKHTESLGVRWKVK